jgi:hypothetical protein
MAAKAKKCCEVHRVAHFSSSVIAARRVARLALRMMKVNGNFAMLCVRAA